MPISSTLNAFPILLLPADLDASSTGRTATLRTDDFEGEAGDMLAMKTGALPNTSEQVTFLVTSRDDLEELEDFIRSVQGRARPFWLPNHREDLTVAIGGGSSMVVRDIDYTASLFPSPAFSYIYVASRDDPFDWAMRSITSSVNNGDGTETLTGSYNIVGFDAATSVTHRFMFVRFVRLESDDVEIQYLDTDRALVTLQVLNIPGSYPPFNLPQGFTPIELTNTVSPYDPTMSIASLRGTPPGDWFTNVVVDPGVLGSTTEFAYNARTWRTEPVASATSFGPLRFSLLAGNGGGTYDRYTTLSMGFTVRQMRSVLGVDTEIQVFNSNLRNTDWAGGYIYPSSSAVSLVLAAGDWFQIELNGAVGLQDGYTDTGNRPNMTYGNPFKAFMYVYGTILPEVP